MDHTARMVSIVCQSLRHCIYYYYSQLINKMASFFMLELSQYAALSNGRFVALGGSGP